MKSGGAAKEHVIIESAEELRNGSILFGEQSRGLVLTPTQLRFGGVTVLARIVIYELGSYGLPARFSHWTFGRDYHRRKHPMNME